MTDRQALTSVVKPTSFELQNAIFRFSEDAPEATAEQSIKDGLAIVGEACSQLAEGKSVDEVIAHLSSLGLSAECSKPLVEKAQEVVSWNNEMATANSHAPAGTGAVWMQAAVPIAVGAAVLLFALWKLGSVYGSGA